MSIATELRDLLRNGFHRMGELELQRDVYGYTYIICHWKDAELSTEPAFGGLDFHQGPDAARDLSTYNEDGEYRFVKARTDLKRGWVMALENEEELRQALDHFYPACLGLFLAQRRGDLDVQHLRDKLNRQTGMYRFARSISDEGARRLVTEVCGSDKPCARNILWQIDDATSSGKTVEDHHNGTEDHQIIPLLCREACNHFVAECRRVAKAEYEQSARENT